MNVKSESEVAQSCLTLHDPMDCSLPGSSTHGIFQAGVLEWGAIAFSVRIKTTFFPVSLVRNNNIILVGKADQFWQPWWERWILHLPRLGAGGPSLEGMLTAISLGGCEHEILSYTTSNKCSREGDGTPLQYSCLENPMDGGAWWATVHGVAKSRT